jgi:protein-tyrosine phosphatase
VNHAVPDELPPFEPSTIVPGFLYLGQEPTSPSDFSQLASLGITEVLNLAVECSPLAEEKSDYQRFIEKYSYLPLRDSIEEKGVQDVLEKSCGILDDAELRGRKVYVHCQAGKSRSCTIVLAYLIRA